MLKRALLILVVIALVTTVADAATFVVPGDRAFVLGAKIIVIGSALSSYTRLTPGDSVDTVTTFSIEESIKGPVTEKTVDVIEPGGIYGDHATTIPGIPRFNDGERYVLFILPTDGGWHVLDLTLGKFSFAIDLNGNELLIRDEEDIAGWDPNGATHSERRRAAAGFLKFLRTEAGGGMGVTDYYVPRTPVKPQKNPESTVSPVPPYRPETSKPRTLQTATTSLTDSASASAPLEQTPTIAPYTASSYTFVIGSYGGRWNVFPGPVTFKSTGTVAGATSGGITAINAAFGAWNNDPASNVNLVYGGADVSGAHNGGTRTADGQNTIAFERDLSYAGAGPFQCTSNSYSGTLGLGGITKAVGTHAGPNGETFYTALEGDVEMNQGIANCSLLLNSGDFNSAVTHEVGHTLGFRHSDQTRADNPSIPCTSDSSLECSNAAIMKSFVAQGLNATLQPWDQHAVQAVYPGTGGGGTPTPPKSSVVFSDERLQPGVTLIKAVHLRELRDAVNQIRAAAGLGPYPFTDAANPGVPVTAIHIQQLRTALDEARLKLGLSTGGWTDPNLGRGTPIKAIHFQEIRDKTKCGC